MSNIKNKIRKYISRWFFNSHFTQVFNEPLYKSRTEILKFSDSFWFLVIPRLSVVPSGRLCERFVEAARPTGSGSLDKESLYSHQT